MKDQSKKSKYSEEPYNNVPFVVPNPITRQLDLNIIGGFSRREYIFIQLIAIYDPVFIRDTKVLEDKWEISRQICLFIESKQKKD